MINRRSFFKKTGAAALFALNQKNELLNNTLSFPDLNANSTNNSPSIPLWKGFNLLNKFNPDFQSPFNEKEFEIMADWGFNFVRLPLSYWCWSSEDDWYKIDEKVLKEIDKAVEFGCRYNLHVDLNFHRLPGYCINNHQPLPTNLFEDEAPLKAAEFHWKHFSERYADYPSSQVSFNLINEAPSVSVEQYDKVARRLITTIRAIDSDRLIFVDGKDVGQNPLMTLTDVPNIVQSGRGYYPMLISHLGASWVNSKFIQEFPPEQLKWPYEENGRLIDRNSIKKVSVEPWFPWIEKGGKVHIGEMGCFKNTPHKEAIAWLKDVFSLFNEQGWGWALWNLTGDFGVLNSNRKDVKYENYKGYLLDREMLELLKQ